MKHIIAITWRRPNRQAGIALAFTTTTTTMNNFTKKANKQKNEHINHLTNYSI